MLTEVPDVVCMGELTFNIEYSESYYGHLHYFIILLFTFFEAFESLLRDNYESFILTIIYTVAFFCDKGWCFQSSRDHTGMNDPCGTCVLIEVSSLRVF